MIGTQLQLLVQLQRQRRNLSSLGTRLTLILQKIGMTVFPTLHLGQIGGRLGMTRCLTQLPSKMMRRQYQTTRLMTRLLGKELVGDPMKEYTYEDFQKTARPVRMTSELFKRSGEGQ